MAKLVLDQVQKKVIPDIVKKLMEERKLPIETHQPILQPTMMSPEEHQRQKHLQYEQIFHQVINDQDNAKVGCFI
jgi:hypothetical protein